MKKWISVVLALILGVCLLSAPASAVEGVVYSEDCFHFTVSDGSITITEYFGNDKVVTVPAMIAGVPVNYIAAGAFADTGVETIYLPDSIMGVEEGATGNATVVFTGAGGAVRPEQTSAPVETIPPGTQQTSESQQPAASEQGTTVVDKDTTDAKTEIEQVIVFDEEESAPTPVPMIETPEPSPAPDTADEPIPAAEPTPAPEETAEPEQTPDPPEAPAQRQSASPVGWIVGGSVLIIAVVSVLLLRKKGGKA